MPKEPEHLLEDFVVQDELEDEENIRPLPKLSWWWFVFYFLGFKKPSVRIDRDQVVHTHDNPKVWPEQTSNIFSRLTFAFFGTLLFSGFYQPLDHEDLWQLHSQDTSQSCMRIFQTNWLKNKPSLLRTLHHSFGWKFYAAALPKFIYDCLQFADPVLLSMIIAFLGEPDDESRHSIWYGFGLIGAIFLVYVSKTLLINQYYHIGFRTGIHVSISMNFYECETWSNNF
jgi:ATP-binding cassette, subfamily C (CFTR/MRP), member 1